MKTDKLYVFLKDKGPFVKKGAVQKLTENQADSLLRRGIVEEYVSKKIKTKAIVATKTPKGDK